MQTKAQNNRDLKKDFFLLILLLVGYVIVCAIPSIFETESRNITVPYRFLVFFFSVYILFKNLYLKNLYLITGLLFCVFWIFYFFKTVYSFHTDYYLPQFINQEYEIYLRIFIINLFPCLALLSIDYGVVDFKKLIKAIFWVLFIMLTINLLYTVFYLHLFNKVNGIFSVYYISSGHFGASLVLLSFYLLLFETGSETVITKKVLIIGIILGFFAIYISAARSPVLALIVVGLYFIVLKKKKTHLYYFLLLLFLSIFMLYFSRQILHLESAFIERNYLGVFEGNASGREPYFYRALTIFKDNILIGGRVLFEDGMYPHNIFLEILMSGGLLLFLFFGLFFFPLLKNISYFFKVNYSELYILPLFALWLQYFILKLTSFNIHSNPEFWYISSVVIGITIKVHHEKT